MTLTHYALTITCQMSIQHSVSWDNFTKVWNTTSCTWPMHEAHLFNPVPRITWSPLCGSNIHGTPTHKLFLIIQVLLQYNEKLCDSLYNIYSGHELQCDIASTKQKDSWGKRVNHISYKYKT